MLEDGRLEEDLADELEVELEDQLCLCDACLPARLCVCVCVCVSVCRCACVSLCVLVCLGACDKCLVTGAK